MAHSNWIELVTASPGAGTSYEREANSLDVNSGQRTHDLRGGCGSHVQAGPVAGDCALGLAYGVITKADSDLALPVGIKN